MENLLKAIPNVVVLITGCNDAEHLCNLEAVLKRLDEADVKVKCDKCRFMLPQVEFLGRIVSADGIRPSTSKTDAIKDAPTPANTTELKAFLGMLNYYCNFLPNLSTVLEPLHKLLRKGVEWRCCTQCSQAFADAKRLLCSSKGTTILLNHWFSVVMPRLMALAVCSSNVMTVYYGLYS